MFVKQKKSVCYDSKSVFAVHLSSAAAERFQMLLGHRFLSRINIGTTGMLSSGLEAKIQDILRPIKSNTYSHQPGGEESLPVL